MCLALKFCFLLVSFRHGLVLQPLCSARTCLEIRFDVPGSFLLCHQTPGAARAGALYLMSLVCGCLSPGNSPAQETLEPIPRPTPTPRPKPEAQKP